MKKHSDRPALRATEVWRWIEKGILKIDVLKNTPIFHLTEGKSVRQKWLQKRKSSATWKSVVTYLRKGIFLVPIWKVVPDWEIKFLNDCGLLLAKEGIAFLNNRYRRLYYMQVDDLDHVLRQTIHTIDGYLAIDPLLAENSADLATKLNCQNQIINRIGNRQINADSLYTIVNIKMKSISRSIRSILANAPAFKRKCIEQDRLTVYNYFEKASQECATLTFQPVFRQLSYASRSLKIAAKHIKNGQRYKAKRCLKSALKNLTYPAES